MEALLLLLLFLLSILLLLSDEPFGAAPLGVFVAPVFEMTEKAPQETCVSVSR